MKRTLREARPSNIFLALGARSKEGNQTTVALSGRLWTDCLIIFVDLASKPKKCFLPLHILHLDITLRGFYLPNLPGLHEDTVHNA